MWPHTQETRWPDLHAGGQWGLVFLLLAGCSSPSGIPQTDGVGPPGDGDVEIDADSATSDAAQSDVDAHGDAEFDAEAPPDAAGPDADGSTADGSTGDSADGANPDADVEMPPGADVIADVGGEVVTPVDADASLAPSDVPEDPIDAPEPDAVAPIEDVGPPGPGDVVEDTADQEPPPVYEGTCCAPNGSPGCGDPDCVAPMCAMDPYCCATTWDTLCATCAGGQGGDEDSCAGLEVTCGCDTSAAGPCCESHASGLCDSLPCTLAVCELDAYCCDTLWDSYCVACAEGGETYDEVSCQGVDADCDCEPPPTGPTHFELAEAWAPVWFHDTDDTDYEADYITAYDFDGDTVSSNNWENLHAPSSDLRAVVYWSIVETTTHWYLLYSDFHPRDWTEDCDPLLPFSEPCHENDMEGAMVMVEKDGSQWGSFVLLITEAHNVLHLFRNDPAITALSTESLEDAPVTFEGGRHPELYVESKGHGVCALQFDGDDHCEHPVGPGVNPFPGGDGIVYRYTGVAEEPTSGNDQDVGYALVSFHDTLWQRRGDICNGSCTFDQTFEYDGVTLSRAFDGDSWGDDKANPPWAWDDPDDGPVYRGDFFFRPAHAVTTWVDLPSAVSQTYIFNPYLDAL